MRNETPPIRRAWTGFCLGLLAASLAMPAMLSFFSNARGDYLLWIFILPVLALPFLAIVAGPGAFLLSWIHAVQMARWAARARTVGEIRRIGVLLGVPLGIGNLILTLAALAALNGSGFDRLKLTPETALLLIPAVAGGAGLGWGATCGLVPGRKES